MGNVSFCSNIWKLARACSYFISDLNRRFSSVTCYTKSATDECLIVAVQFIDKFCALEGLRFYETSSLLVKSVSFLSMYWKQITLCIDNWITDTFFVWNFALRRDEKKQPPTKKQNKNKTKQKTKQNNNNNQGRNLSFLPQEQDFRTEDFLNHPRIPSFCALKMYLLFFSAVINHARYHAFS